MTKTINQTAESEKNQLGRVTRPNNRVELSNAQRLAIWSTCHCQMTNGHLRRGQKKLLLNRLKSIRGRLPGSWHAQWLP